MLLPAMLLLIYTGQSCTGNGRTVQCQVETQTRDNHQRVDAEPF